MKLTLTSTPEILEYDGRRVRKWTGTTDGGIPVEVLVIGIITATDAETLRRFRAEAAATGLVPAASHALPPTPKSLS